jgi:UDPglucose 6-dehydrogenase
MFFCIYWIASSSGKPYKNHLNSKLEGFSMKIAVVGTGYVGLVTGTCLAEVGHEVTCVDIDEEKIKTLNNGGCPIFEPGLEKLIGSNIEHERLFFTTNLKSALDGAEVCFIAVGTPEGEDGSADLRYVLGVAKEVGRIAPKDLLVVVKSTVPVGTCDKVEEALNSELKNRRERVQFTVASNPEFLKEGAAVEDFLRPDRIIVGLKSGTGEDLMRDIYRPFILDDPGKLFVIDRRSSELTKYGSNAMLATRISFMNELARLCEKVGANIDHVRRGMGSDPRIGKKFLYAGPGYGGSCFPKDVQALVRSGEEFGVSLEVLHAVTTANKAQKEFVANKLKRHFGDLTGKRIVVWGLAFKPGTDDVRETPSLILIQKCLAAGAEVIAHDPEAAEAFQRSFGTQKGLSYSTSSYEALEGADALVLMTEWSEYRRPNWEKIGQLMRTKAIFDFRNQYDPSKVIAAGFHYECVGRPDSVVAIK